VNTLEAYEHNLAKFYDNNLSTIVLDPCLPRELNSKLIDNQSNYLGMNPKLIPIVIYICKKCRNNITSRPHPRKLDLFCFHCGIPYP